MKIQITYKDPDGVYLSINNYVEDNMPEGLSGSDYETRRQEMYEEVQEAISKFAGDYLTIEIDTDADTATVVD